MDLRFAVSILDLGAENSQADEYPGVLKVILGVSVQRPVNNSI